jgi:hypothetical protein
MFAGLTARIIAGLLVVGAFIGLCWWGASTIYEAGRTAGRAEVKTLWDANRQDVEQKVAQIQAENAEKLRALDDANQETVDEYEHKLATVTDSVASYANRLRAVEARLSAANNRPDPVPTASEPATPPAPIALGAGQFEQLLGARLAECDVNEAQLKALIVEVTPQLPVDTPEAPP